MSEFTHRLPHSGWSKPSRNEEEYFRREHFRQRMDRARKQAQDRADVERAAWLQAHGGRCPECGRALEEVREEGVNVHQCPQCLGVWMDHAAFDRLTHPDPPNAYLTGIFRDVLLAYTTGNIRTEHPQERA